MNFRYINREKTKKISKYKLFVSTYLLCGVLSLSGCAINNLNNNSNIGSGSVNSESQINEEEKLYSVQFYFDNLDYLNENGKDLIVVYNKNGKVYSGGYITSYEENYEIVVPVQDFMISSEMLGHFEVHVEEDEEVLVYIDYLNKTLDVEKNVDENNRVR